MALAFDEVTTPRLVIAGASGAGGKTTITAGLVAALRRRELRVKPFKVGPDHVDAAYLAEVAGVPCRHLDPWMLGADAILRSFHRGCAEGDIAVVEGMLGLFDSWGAGSEGSTGEVARLLAAPVVLVLDVAGTVQSAAAVALGFRTIDPRVKIAGVILNRVDSEDHGRWVEEAIWRLARVPVLGSLPVLPALDIPDSERGLTPVGELHGGAATLAGLADAVERHVDLDVLLRIADHARPLREVPRQALPGAELTAPLRLGVAYDDAFNLYYPENLEILAEAGAEIVPFSPLDDARVPAVDAVYMAGALSERHAARLSGNARMLRSVHDAHADGMPIYAECGGLMYLSESLTGEEGQVYPMAGLVPVRVETEAAPRQMGYRQLRTTGDCLLGPAGRSLRGHEFHWSRLTNGAASKSPAYELSDPSGYRSGLEGYVAPRLLASNIHVHFGQDPGLAVHLLRACVHGVAAV